MQHPDGGHDTLPQVAHGLDGASPSFPSERCVGTCVLLESVKPTPRTGGISRSRLWKQRGRSNPMEHAKESRVESNQLRRPMCAIDLSPLWQTISSQEGIHFPKKNRLKTYKRITDDGKAHPCTPSPAPPPFHIPFPPLALPLSPVPFSKATFRPPSSWRPAWSSTACPAGRRR